MYYKVKDETIADIAEAIRTKNGVAGEIKVEDFAQSILDLNTGENTEAAAQSASEAAASAISAESSALSAAESAGQAAETATMAIEETTAIYESASQKASEAATSAEESEASADKAKASEVDAEAWAIGTRDGVEVSSEDETYQNNAKYWAEQAFSMVNWEEFTDIELQDIWNGIFQQGVSE